MTRIFVLACVPVRRLAVAAGLLASVAAIGLAIPAAAAAKVTSLTSCPVLGIFAPGTYRLDADVSKSFGDCIDIFASGTVTLNLNGHSITSDMSPASSEGVVDFGGPVSIVGPGTISGWGEAGIHLLGNSTVRGVTATGNSFGIEIRGPGDSVRGNVTTGNADVGMVLDPGATGNTIIGNFAYGNGGRFPGSGVDLFDSNANCDSNVWLGNDFGTANMSCIH